MLRGMGKDLGVCNKHNHLLHLALFFLPVKIKFQLAMLSTILFSKCRNEGKYGVLTKIKFCWSLIPRYVSFIICKSSNWDVVAQLSASSGACMLACLCEVSLTGHACSLGLNMVMNMSNPHVPVCETCR